MINFSLQSKVSGQGNHFLSFFSSGRLMHDGQFSLAEFEASYIQGSWTEQWLHRTEAVELAIGQGWQGQARAHYSCCPS